MCMKRLYHVTLWALLLTLPCDMYAQKGKWIKPISKALTTPAVDRAVLRSVKRPDIRLSVARLDHAVLLDYPMNKRPHSTAFLLQTQYKGKPEIWAVTAGHTAQPGERIRLTFYDGKNEIPLDGTLVQHGPALLSDVALIELDGLPPAKLRPLTLTTHIEPHEKLTTWGYASNKLYQVGNLSFEKDNTRFIRTDFPTEQTKRSGLCGGPLLNSKGQVLGVHCGSTWEDKSYASSMRIIPYLLQAYHEGNAQIPVVAKGIDFGSIELNERIIYIQCMDAHGHLINQENLYDQLPQSLLMALYQDPEVRYLRFVLGSYQQDTPSYRVLVYDKKTATHHFEPLYRQHYIK